MTIKCDKINNKVENDWKGKHKKYQQGHCKVVDFLSLGWQKRVNINITFFLIS